MKQMNTHSLPLSIHLKFPKIILMILEINLDTKQVSDCV